MNHRCAVIGVAANVTQWTPPRVGQTDGQTEKFNTISRRYKGDNLGSKVKDDSQVVRLRSGSH